MTSRSPARPRRLIVWPRPTVWPVSRREGFVPASLMSWRPCRYFVMAPTWARRPATLAQPRPGIVRRYWVSSRSARQGVDLGGNDRHLRRERIHPRHRPLDFAREDVDAVGAGDRLLRVAVDLR